MPQADQKLRDKFKDDDAAWEVLFRAGFETKKGIIFPPDTRRKWDDLSQDEKDAIDYLCDEWDYGWAGFR